MPDLPPIARRRLPLALSLALAACGDPERPGQGAAASGSTGSPSAAAPSTAQPASSDSPSSAPAPATAGSAPPEPPMELDPNRVAAEPSRRTLRAVADDPALDAHRDLLADRYGVVQLPFPLELQEVPLPHGRRALLFTGQGAALDKPVILVVGAGNTLFWSKPRPLVGTRERTREPTLSRGPHGEVLVFWYDEPTRIVAAREWTHEGSIFADYVLFTAVDCDGLSVVYWPGRGWITALTEGRALRVQLLGENGTRAWSDSGLEIPIDAPASAAHAPAPRPRVAVPGGDVIEITVGARKVRVSSEGKLVKG